MEFALFFFRHERNGCTVGISSGRATDAMNVILRVMRYVIINDQSYLIDIDTSGNNIGCHQNIDFIIFKIKHDRFALQLLQV